MVQRAASSPSVVKVPANQLQQVIRQQGAQLVSGAASTPGRTKIITVKRVGPNGSVTQSRSFTISADAAASLTGSQKIIVQTPNGTSQVARTGSPAAVTIQQPVSQTPGTIKIPLSLVQTGSPGISNQNVVASTSVSAGTSFESQFQQFAQSFQSNSNNVKVQDLSQVVSTQPHVIQITRPLSAPVNPVVTRTLPQSARLVSSQTMASPSIRVIQRPFQNNNGTSPSLQHSQSVPASMSDFNITKIPSHLLDDRETSSPPLFLSRQQGPMKMVVNDGLSNGLDLENLSGMQSLSAMHRSVQSIPIPKIVTNKDVSRMWSNTDMRLKNITSNVVSFVSSL